MRFARSMGLAIWQWSLRDSAHKASTANEPPSSRLYSFGGTGGQHGIVGHSSDIAKKMLAVADVAKGFRAADAGNGKRASPIPG
jgi:hypothetical protein